MTCHCLEDAYQIGPCEIRVFIRDFSINLTFGTGLSLPETWFARHDSPTKIEMNFESVETDKSEQTQTGSIATVIGPVARVSGGTETTDSTAGSISKKLGYNSYLERISVGGTSNSVTWQFKCAPHELHFSGAVLDDTKMTSVQEFDESDVEATFRIPKYGVFASAGRSRTIRELRAFSIFALVVRKKITGNYNINVR